MNLAKTNPFVTLLMSIWLTDENSLSGKLGIVPSIDKQVKICVYGCRSLWKVILAEKKIKNIYI